MRMWTIPYSLYDIDYMCIKRLWILVQPLGYSSIYSGLAYNFYSRDFVEFALTSKVSKYLLEWSRETYSPDEHFWATLVKQIPDEDRTERYSMSHFVLWAKKNLTCHGSFRHNICVFNENDVETLRNVPQEKCFWAGFFNTSNSLKNFESFLLTSSTAMIDQVRGQCQCWKTYVTIHELKTM